MNGYEYSEEDITGHLVAVGGCLADTYLVIPEVYFSVHPAIMPVYSHLFGIRPTGVEETRTDKRIRVGDMEDLTM